jgi:hypothetical protein
MAVQRARQHADRADDLAHRCRRETALRESARRFVEQLRQSAVGAPARGIHADIRKTNDCSVKRESRDVIAM